MIQQAHHSQTNQIEFDDEYENQRITLVEDNWKVAEQYRDRQKSLEQQMRYDRCKCWLLILLFGCIMTSLIISFNKQTLDDTLLLKSHAENQEEHFKKYKQTSKKELKIMLDRLDNNIKKYKQQNQSIEKEMISQMKNAEQEIGGIGKDSRVNQTKELVIDSKITNDTKTLASFFDKRIVQSFNLLYRASDNEFQVSKFHDKCDNIPNTLTLIKTQFGKVVGGFTGLVWDRKRDRQFTVDQNASTFIFSVEFKEKFMPIKPNSQVIKNYQSFGPVFAGSPGAAELIIFNNANSAQINFSEFPNNFNNDKKYPHSIEISKRFTGTEGRFRIDEWEVFEVKFE